MRVLITGANGQLGFELQKVLADCELILSDKILNSKIQDTITKQIPNSKFQKNQNFVELDITDIDKVHEVFNKEKPEWVVHTAAYTNVDGAQDNEELAFEVNRDGSRNVAQASQAIGAKLIAISTDYVFDGVNPPAGGYTPDSPPNPLGVYGESKLAGEIVALTENPDAIVLRTAWLYGGLSVLKSKIKNQKYPDLENHIFKNFPNTILQKVFTGEEVKVVNDQFGSPTYARDLAQVIKKITVKAGIEPGVYHAVNSGAASWYEFADEIAKELRIKNCELKIKPCQTAEFPTKARRPKYTVLETEKLKKIGIELPSWQDGLKRFLNF